MKRSFGFLTVCMAAVALVACGSNTQPEAPVVIEPAPEVTAPAVEQVPIEGSTIAYLTPSRDVPFWNYIIAGIETQATAYQAIVCVYSANNDVDVQLANAQQAIAQQVDAMIISPVNSDSCVQVLDLAKQADIPVVVCDVGTDAGTYVTYISSDNEGGAKELGAYVAGLLEEGDTLAQITLDQGRINGQMRKSGFEMGMIHEGVEQVDSREMELHTYDEGVAFTKNLIANYPYLDVIFAHAEDPTLGVMDALEALGREDILVVGFDFTEKFIVDLEEGRLAATAAQQPVLMGTTAVEQVAKALGGKATAAEINLPTLLITQENIDTLKENGGLDTVYVPSQGN